MNCAMSVGQLHGRVDIDVFAINGRVKVLDLVKF